MAETMRLSAGQCEIELGAIGAEVMAWRMAGRDLIWHGDAAFWPRRAPVLFPFCGWLKDLKFRAKGQEYATDVHGFGRTAAFAMQQLSPARARLSLQSDAGTLAQFPYQFALEIIVEVSETGFSYGFHVRNPGEEILPFSLGFHPGFLWPFDGGDKMAYQLRLERDETPEPVVIAPGGLFTRDTHPLPLKNRMLDLSRTFEKQDSIVLRDAASRSVEFIAPSGRKIAIATENFPNWVFWTKPGAGYLCIERWSGQGDPVDFTGEIVDKPGMTLLAPGARCDFAFRCEYL